MFCCIHSPDAERIAALFSPAYELTAPDTAIFDASTLARLIGPPDEIARQVYEAAGRSANVAVAANPYAAVLAARNFAGLTVINDDAGAALADLAVDTLPLSPELLDLLDLWGIRTLGDLAALPEAGIAERLGEEAARVCRLARATLTRPLRVHQPEEFYAGRIEIEHPIELLEPLLFLAARILNEQCAKLTAHGLATNEVRLTLSLTDSTDHCRTLSLPVPMRDAKALLKLVQMDLEAHPPGAPMAAVGIALSPVQPRRMQHGLFIPQAPEPEKLELTLGRIRGLVGEENVGIAELLDTHRPAPFRLLREAPHPGEQTMADGPRIAFRWFRPPLPAQVELRDDRPVRLTAPGLYGKILNASGPWRTSGDWWTPEAWNRDEWDIALNNGALYRIYHEPDGAWRIDGVYD